MLKADEIIEFPQKYIDNKWVKARPIIYSLKQRLKDAFKVLTGKADAIMFYKQ